jgi:hypothetical protein
VLSPAEELAAGTVYDPLAWVYGAYPWGKAGTFLADESGPDVWQIQVLEAIGRAMRGEGPPRIAVASGHGIGKTALAAWVTQMFTNTRPHPQVKVTANTGAQLRGKTWRELAKWHKASRFSQTFTHKASKYFHNGHPDTWFAEPVTWSKEQSEAFAGTHERYVLMMFDEASAIDDVIWEVAEGAMTTEGALWLVWGNPTRTTGRFRECFPGGRFAHRWFSLQVDSRTAKKANQKQLAEWIEDYGIDSDFVRVRVLGVFPRQSANQFISDELIALAKRREALVQPTFPLLLGVDVARFGDDRSVILARQGTVILEKLVYRELDTMQLAARVAQAIDVLSPHAVFVDVVGIGAGVVDRLRQLGYAIMPVNVGETAAEPLKYTNKRAEIWDTCREWLKGGGCLPPGDLELEADLRNQTYLFDARERLMMTPKDILKRDGLASPDSADALCLTFAEPVSLGIRQRRRPVAAAHGTGFNPLRRN